MSRYQNMFTQLKQANQGAFVPFVMLGDPDIETSLLIIDRLVANGADALELGFPFSDPIADGPTIQAASIRALAAKVTPNDCFDMLKQIRSKYPDLPIGLLLYCNLVLAPGLTAFYSQAAESGVDSILIADVPMRQAQPFIDVAEQHQIAQILITPPNANQSSIQQLGNLTQGYTYLLGRAGVTGAETSANVNIEARIQQLAEVNAAPAIIGFGISAPQQVKAALDAGAAGVIAGSAVINIIADNLSQPQQMLDKLGRFILTMKKATQKELSCGT